MRFFGNVSFGVDVHRAQLLAHYDAVLYATGARHDRDLGVPGEHLPGSYGAAEFVSWYSGHPEAAHRDLLSGARTAVVIGAGNVALDVVRILAKDAGELVDTDMPDAVIEFLGRSTLTDIHLLARRGPAHAKFTAVEVRELGELVNADVVIDSSDLQLDPDSAAVAEASTSASHNLRLLEDFASRDPGGRPRRIHLHFWTSPVALLGTDRVEAIALRVSPPDGHPLHNGAARTLELPAQLVLRAIGYQARPLPEVPFDPERATVPNREGRVVDDAGEVLPGEYVSGWLKRGPSGVIATNRTDARETVAAMLADLAARPARGSDPQAVIELLRQRGVQFVDWAGWQRLERYEAALGAARNAATIKVADRQAMLDVIHGASV